MLKNITINLNALEYILFFWESVIDNEKVGEYYLNEVADLDELSILYDDEFTKESVRKVLSSITNKEPLSTATPREKKFWNNNMYVTEDRGILAAMLAPVKQLNLDKLKEELNEEGSYPHEEIEIIFIPGFEEFTIREDNKLYINFFKIMVDVFHGTGDVTIDGKDIETFIKEQLQR